MQKLEDEPSTGQLVLRYLICYGALFLFGAFCMWILFVARELMIAVGFRLRASPWQIRAIDTWGTFLLGLIWLIVFMVAEGYLRHAVRSDLLGRRIIRVYSLATVVAAVILLANWIL